MLLFLFFFTDVKHFFSQFFIQKHVLSYFILLPLGRHKGKEDYSNGESCDRTKGYVEVNLPICLGRRFTGILFRKVKKVIGRQGRFHDEVVVLVRRNDLGILEAIICIAKTRVLPRAAQTLQLIA